MSYPMLWLILLVAFALLEGLTAALVSVWFCAGSLAAFFVSVADIGIGVQIGVFAGISLLSMVIIRPIVKKYWQPKLQKTNVDSVLGKEGLVTETIDNISGTGQVKIGGIIWTARSEDGNHKSNGSKRTRRTRSCPRSRARRKCSREFACWYRRSREWLEENRQGNSR